LQTNLSFFLSAVKNTVDYRLKNGIKRNDFIDQLIEIRAEDQEAAKKGKGIDLSKGLTLEQMAAQAFVFFVAGFETSSSTMSYCLYELALQPEIQQRVRDEIESVLANEEGGKLNYDALARMSYLDQVVAGKYDLFGSNINESKHIISFRNPSQAPPSPPSHQRVQ